MTRNRLFSMTWLFVVTLATFVVSPAFGLDEEKERDRGRGTSKQRGYVDGSQFAELADKDGTVIQVSLQGPLLKMVTKALGEENKEVAAVLDEVVSISAVVVGVAEKKGRAAELVDDTAAALAKEGWQTIARVREEGSTILVLALMDSKGEALDGLTVVVSDSNEEQLVFANIAGRIDLEMIGKLGMKLGVSGLDQLSGDVLKSEVKKRKSKSEDNE